MAPANGARGHGAIGANRLQPKNESARVPLHLERLSVTNRCRESFDVRLMSRAWSAHRVRGQASRRGVSRPQEGSQLELGESPGPFPSQWRKWAKKIYQGLIRRKKRLSSGTSNVSVLNPLTLRMASPALVHVERLVELCSR